MGGKDFSRAKCIRALKKLGFYLGNKRKGKHDKFYPPQVIAAQLVGQQPRFIMVPRHAQLHCQNEILSELQKMGGSRLVDDFMEKL